MPLFLTGSLLYAPLLVLMKLRLYSGDKAEEQVFAHFFKGWEYGRFLELGRAYASEIERMRREPVISRMKEHIVQGDMVYVVSASIREWVEPWSLQQGAHAVLATEIEVDSDGKLTGRFKTRNCNGEEKVNRLLQAETDRQAYHLAAYGNSHGDHALLAFADEGTLCQ